MMRSSTLVTMRGAQIALGRKRRCIMRKSSG